MKDEAALARGWFLKADSDLADAEHVRAIILANIPNHARP